MIGMEKHLKFIEIEEIIERSVKKLEKEKGLEAAKDIKHRLLSEHFQDDPKKGGYGDVCHRKKKPNKSLTADT